MNNKKNSITAALLFLTLVFIIPHRSSQAEEKSITVSIPPLQYIIDALSDHTIPVIVLATAGNDPHTYEPTPAQMRQTAQSTLLLTIGVPYEAAWIPRIAGSTPTLKIISTITGITRERFTDNLDLIETTQNTAKDQHSEHADHAHGEDPHVWLSPQLMRTIVATVANILCETYPDRAQMFTANAAKLDAEIVALDKELEALFAQTPEPQRIFLTFHPAWRYFAHHYRLKNFSIEVDGKEPGLKAMKAIIDAATRLRLSALFIEPQFPQKTAKAIAQNIHARVVTVDPIAYDWPATLRTMAQELAASFPVAGH